MTTKWTALVYTVAFVLVTTTTLNIRAVTAIAGEAKYLSKEEIFARVIGGTVNGPEWSLTYKDGGEIVGENYNGPFWGKWSVRDDSGKGRFILDYDVDEHDKERYLGLSQKGGKLRISFYTLDGDLKGTFSFTGPNK